MTDKEKKISNIVNWYLDNYCLHAEYWHSDLCDGTMCHHPDGYGDCPHAPIDMKNCKLFERNRQ